MRVAVAVVLAVLAVAVWGAAERGPAQEQEAMKLTGKPALELDAESFERLTQVSQGMTTGNWFVMFYAPWCGHCKRLAPALDEVSKMSPAHGANVAKVNCDEHGSLCRRFGVRGYPTIILFARNKMYRYNLQRLVDVMSEWLQTGWQSAEGAPIPPPSTLLGEVQYWGKLLAEEFVMLYNKQPMIIVGMAAVLIITFAITLYLAARPTGARSPPRRKPKAE